MLSIVALVLMGLAVIGAFFNLASAMQLHREPKLVELGEWPAVTVLKPLHGAEPALVENLHTLFAQDYPAPVQIIFGTRDPADPALDAVAQVVREFPAADVTIVTSDKRWGANNKLSNLTNMDEQGRHPLVVIADSDVAWKRDTLKRLAVALNEPEVGLVSCLHPGRGDAGFWSRVAAMDISYRFMPGAAMAVAFNLAKPVLGPTMAFSRANLERIGGFQAFGDVLADDYEIGVAIRALGLKSTLSNFYIVHGCSEPSLDALAWHELRWTVNIYRIDPAGYAGSIVLQCLPLALFGAALAGFSSLSLAVLAVASAARALVKWRMDRVSGTVAGPLWLVPFRDLLSFALYCATFFVHTIDWRGSRFRVTRDGRLQSR